MNLAQVIIEAINKEREECARIAEMYETATARDIAAAIRAEKNRSPIIISNLEYEVKPGEIPFDHRSAPSSEVRSGLECGGRPLEEVFKEVSITPQMKIILDYHRAGKCSMEDALKLGLCALWMTLDRFQRNLHQALVSTHNPLTTPEIEGNERWLR